MKLGLKHIYFCSLLGLGGMAVSSCDDFLSREPITSVTPEAYFTSADQLGAYVLNYYTSHLVNSRGNTLFHDGGYNTGVTTNDNNTDNFIKGDADLNYFAGQKLVPAGKNLQNLYGRVRVWNWMLEQVLPKEEAGTITGSPEEIKHYIGEAYFFRALAYYNGLVQFGDLPIVTVTLKDDPEELVKNSLRAPRNEVARFILKDLDEAIARLKDKGFMNNQRINKQVAQLLKSRVALFEATFEKYHKGSGRVPGDDKWPGAAYHKDKTFDIDGEINFFLTEAMNAAKDVAEKISLTPNSHQINPQLGQISGWNPYFEMFGKEDLSSDDEVLLWKEYSLSMSVKHDAPYLIQGGGDKSGLSRGMINSFLMKDGLPYYVSQNYQGDKSINAVKTNRDERLQLFVFGEDDVLGSDMLDPRVIKKGDLARLDTLKLVVPSQEERDYTGYRSRKYQSYDYQQYKSNEVICTTASIVFRGTEAYLNYIEACYEKNGSLDNTATLYWQRLRERAGVSTDLAATDAATDLAKEFNQVGNTIYGDLAVYSGDQPVDVTLYNIRRERRNELISEGMRWDDLKRWRSWDKLLTGRYMFQGINLWDEAYKLYVDQKTGESLLIPSGDNTANVSQPNDPLTGQYLSQLRRDLRPSNQLREGYSWMKAFYLEPLGVQDLTLTATDPTDPSTSVMYQNPYWPNTAGRALE